MYITLIITFSLFFFVLFLVYLIYCYAYYDEYQVSLYTEMFNKGRYTLVYNNFDSKDKIDYEDYSKVINLMYDKNSLKNIYYLYYNEIMTLDDFINIYYYGSYKIEENDITFLEIGKTNLLKRKKIKYQEIKVLNNEGYQSNLGIKENVILEVENNSRLYLDDTEIVCKDNICNIDYIFGGLHEITYISNNIEYYGIINVNKDKQVIKIPLVNSLVKKEKKIDEEVVKVIKDSELEYGKYKLKECYLSSGCPSKSKSYIMLNEDGKAYFYTYITLDQAGDYYEGTFLIEGEFLVLKFDSHVYTVFDYDTKVATDIEAECDIEFRFKIEDKQTIRNNDYLFKYSM